MRTRPGRRAERAADIVQQSAGAPHQRDRKGRRSRRTRSRRVELAYHVTSTTADETSARSSRPRMNCAVAVRSARDVGLSFLGSSFAGFGGRVRRYVVRAVDRNAWRRRLGNDLDRLSKVDDDQSGASRRIVLDRDVAEFTPGTRWPEPDRYSSGNRNVEDRTVCSR